MIIIHNICFRGEIKQNWKRFGEALDHTARLHSLMRVVSSVCLSEEALGTCLSTERTAKTLISLRGRAD